LHHHSVGQSATKRYFYCPRPSSDSVGVHHDPIVVAVL
jgi:hypothetical protein